MEPKTRTIEPHEPPGKPRAGVFGAKLTLDIPVQPPRITRVLTYVEGISLAEQIRKVVVDSFPNASFRQVESPLAFASMEVDATPTVLFVDDRTICDINRALIKTNFPNLSIVLLSSRELICTTPLQEMVKLTPELAGADFIAATVGTETLDSEKTIHSFIRLSEDKLCLDISSSKTKRFTVLVVDDEPRWFAEFLPKLYAIVGRRADITIARTYEEANAFLDRHGRHTVCLITDMFFPKNGVVTDEAGKELLRRAQHDFPKMAKAIASTADVDDQFKAMALVLTKGSEESIANLRRFVNNYAGFGDFLIKVNGIEQPASTISELHDLVNRADIDDIEANAARDNFSTWLYMHGFYSTGDAVKAVTSKGRALVSELSIILHLGIVQLNSDPFVIRDESGNEICNTFSLREIKEKIKTLPAEMLEKWEEDDHLSFWLMRHGYTQLADELRSVLGKGEPVRIQVLALFDKWIPHYEQNEYAGD